MTDAFAELVMPVFRKGLALHDRLSRGGEAPSLDEVKKSLAAAIEEARRRSLGSPVLQRSYGLAMFGLVAWLDEVLTESEGGRVVGWKDNILEWDLFETHDRAWRFYKQHARDAEEAGDMDALEVYLLAVTLGFRGEYVNRDPELANWVHRVYERISESASVPDRPFGEDVPRQDAYAPLRGPSILLTVSVLTSITALFTLAAYLFSVHVLYDSKHQGDSAAPASVRAGANPSAVRVASE